MEKVAYYFKVNEEDVRSTLDKINLILKLLNKDHCEFCGNIDVGYYYILSRDETRNVCSNDISKDIERFKKDGYEVIDFDNMNVKERNPPSSQYPIKARCSDINEIQAEHNRYYYKIIGEFFDKSNGVRIFISETNGTYHTWKYIVPKERAKVTKEQIAKKFNVKPEYLKIIG